MASSKDKSSQNDEEQQGLLRNNGSNYGTSHQDSPDDDDDEELSGKSISDKKAHLVSKEIDAIGMGRYQWFLWTLCGLGYLLDLLWAQAFGLILTPLQQELGIPASKGGTITTAFAVGLTFGAAFWGAVVDVVGRRWAFNLTCLFSSAFGLGLAAAKDYPTFLVLAAFVGFGVGGNIPVDTAIALEFLPSNKRRLLPLLSVFQPIGVVLTTVIAYIFVPSNKCEKGLPSCLSSAPGEECCGIHNNFGWRYTLITVGIITTVAFILRSIVFSFHESPGFLIGKGKDQAAITVLEKVSKFNGREKPGLTLERLNNLGGEDDNQDEDEEAKDWKDKLNKTLKPYRYLFSNFTLARLTILIWITYACDFWGFTISSTFTPQILLAKGAANGISIYDVYKSYIYIYLPGILGVLLGVWGYELPRIGRQWTMVLTSALMAGSLILFGTINSQAANITTAAMVYFFQSAFNSVLYGWTPEAFPGFIRGTATGFASFVGRLFSIIAPLAAEGLLPEVPPEEIPWQYFATLLYMGGGVAFGATAALVLLPQKAVSGKSN